MYVTEWMMCTDAMGSRVLWTFPSNWKLCFGQMFVLTCLFVRNSLANYPDSGRIKPCVIKTKVIEYQAHICIPTQNGFDPVSEENCRTTLRAECPEFNMGNCEWFSYSWNSTNTGRNCEFYDIKFPACKLRYETEMFMFSYSWNSTNTGRNCEFYDIKFPACKLRYKAEMFLPFSKVTWMEIFYVNQFGSADSDRTVRSIVEMHRNRKHYFEGTDQPDWPLSVSDPGSVAGILWEDDLTNFKQYYQAQKSYKTEVNLTNLCLNGKDDANLCGQVAKSFVISYLKHMAIEDFVPGQMVAACIQTILERDGTKKDVCQIAKKAMREKLQFSTYMFQLRVIKDDVVMFRNTSL